MGFWEMVGGRLAEIKRTFAERSRSRGLEYDEDVLDDTIERCAGKFGTGGSDEEMMAYLWTAFRNNTVRELGYARNRTEGMDEYTDIEDEVDVVDDMYEDVSGFIRSEFGEEAFALFFAHANGTPYDELEKMSEGLNLRYLFRKIRERTREKFSD